MASPRSDLEFVLRDRTVPTTTSASKSNKNLKAAGHDNGNVGQGAEQTDLIARLHAYLDRDPNQEDKSYNAEVGGAEDVKKGFAGWGQRILGIPGKTDTTFVQEQLGRSMFTDVAEVLNSPYRNKEFWLEFAEHLKPPAVLIPKNSWGMSKTILADAGFEVIEYDVDPENIAASYEAALERHSKTHIIASSYFNFPHNATGAHLSIEENKKIKAIADKFNAGNAHKMTLMYDLPYYAACDKAGEDLEAYLDTGMEGVFDPDDFDPSSDKEVQTPIAIFASGSKFFRTARKGLNFSYVSKDLAPTIKGRLIKSGHGLNYDPVLFANLAEGLKPENDKWWKQQLDADRKKFEANYVTLKQAFGDAVLPGGVNLVQLVKLEGVFNRTVVRHDGQPHKIGLPEDGGVTDALELYDNGTPNTDGVVMVDGGKAPDGSPLLRIALASEPNKFAEYIGRIKEIQDYIQSPEAQYTPV